MARDKRARAKPARGVWHGLARTQPRADPRPFLAVPPLFLPLVRNPRARAHIINVHSPDLLLPTESLNEGLEKGEGGGRSAEGYTLSDVGIRDVVRAGIPPEYVLSEWEHKQLSAFATCAGPEEAWSANEMDRKKMIKEQLLEKRAQIKYEDWETTANGNGIMNASDALSGTKRPTTRLKGLRIHSTWEIHGLSHLCTLPKQETTLPSLSIGSARFNNRPVRPRSSSPPEAVAMNLIDPIFFMINAPSPRSSGPVLLNCPPTASCQLSRPFIRERECCGRLGGGYCMSLRGAEGGINEPTNPQQSSPDFDVGGSWNDGCNETKTKDQDSGITCDRNRVFAEEQSSERLSSSV
ncbi:hypothetical protein DFH11DRAFT_1543298 [Phellopilus nigrolimitatus]|nr:hypothetical protein DFH11DRAFT_1543298 [Phellopilus nigrolimitatus]